MFFTGTTISISYVPLFSVCAIVFLDLNEMLLLLLLLLSINFFFLNYKFVIIVFLYQQFLKFGWI